MTRLLLVLVAALAAGVGVAQPPSGGYRPVDPQPLPLDPPNTWTLHFAYTPPRIVTLDVPKQGRKVVWYLAYQVWNTTDTPRTVIPRFYLVTKDGPLLSLPDDQSPSLVDQVRASEDPHNALNMQTTNSISKTPVPVTRPDSIPRAVYGVAVWPDVAEKAPTVNNFSIYVTGLSDGSSTSVRDGVESVTRKTLQLDFIRPTDTTRQTLGDIRPNDNGGLGAYKWIYRAAKLAPLSADGK